MYPDFCTDLAFTNMPPMRIHSLVISFFAIALALCGCAARQASLVNDPGDQLSVLSKSALCIPIDTLHVSYFDNTKAIPDSLFNDSFFIEAANGLLSYEVSKRFNIMHWTPRAASQDAPDSLDVFRHCGFSRLTHDTASLALIAGRVRGLSKKYNADLVIVPYACMIKHITVRPAGWRNDEFAGPGYDRPISYTAKTEFHVQIWDKNGALLYERIGRSDTGRPVFYSFLKKEKHPDKDIVKYAKRFYAPPLVKSLYNSIKAAMQVRT
jgi:hypothetical protein